MAKRRWHWSWIEIFQFAFLIVGYALLGVQFGWPTAFAFILINYGHRK